MRLAKFTFSSFPRALALRFNISGDFQDRASRKPFECFALIGSVTLFWAVIGYIFHM